MIRTRGNRRSAITSIVLLVAFMVLSSSPVAFSDSTPSADANKHKPTLIHDTTSDTTALKAQTDKTKRFNARTRSASTPKSNSSSTTAGATAMKTLQGGTAKSRKLKPIAQQPPVFGNGRSPDPYVPNTLYRPNPPANKLIHAVESNSR